MSLADGFGGLIVSVVMISLKSDQGGDCGGSDGDGVEGWQGIVRGGGWLGAGHFEGGGNFRTEEGDLVVDLIGRVTGEHLFFNGCEVIPVDGVVRVVVLGGRLHCGPFI